MNYINQCGINSTKNFFDIIVVGGGIIGCAVAYFASKQGRIVLVLDQSNIGSKQSGKAWGFIRRQLRNLSQIPMMNSSIEMWKNLEIEFGEDIFWKNTGGIQLIENKKDLIMAEAWLNSVKDLGLDTEIIYGDELKRKLPRMISGPEYAIYTPSDGQVDPYKVINSFQKRAIYFGTSFLENIEYEEIYYDNEKFTFTTNKGKFIGGQVVCCAGVGSYFFLKKLGISIPQLPARVSSLKTYPLPIISESTFLGRGIGFRQDKDGCITLGCQNESNIDLTLRYAFHGYKFLKNKDICMNDLSIDFSNLFRNEAKDELIPKVNLDHIKLAKDRFQKLFYLKESFEIQKCWAEYIDFLPNLNPIISRHPVIKNLVIATGFSGSGLALGPIVGKLISEILEYKNTSINIESFNF